MLLSDLRGKSFFGDKAKSTKNKSWLFWLKMSKLVTPEFRGSFVHILEPHAIKGVENAKARYQITIPLSKKDAFWTKLNALVEETAKAKWGKIPPIHTNISYREERAAIKWPVCYLSIIIIYITGIISANLESIPNYKRYYL